MNSSWKSVTHESRLSGEIGRNVSRKPRLVGGAKGHNMKEISSPGSPALWAGSFTPWMKMFEGYGYGYEAPAYRQAGVSF